MARALRQRLTAMLAGNDPDRSWAAAYALSEIPLVGAAESLRVAAAIEDDTTRLFACRGLARLVANRVVNEDDFLAFLDQENPHIIVDAAAALAELASESAIPGLRRVFLERQEPADFHARAACLAALSELLDPMALEPLLERGLQDPARRVRAEALRQTFARAAAGGGIPVVGMARLRGHGGASCCSTSHRVCRCGTVP